MERASEDPAAEDDDPLAELLAEGDEGAGADVRSSAPSELRALIALGDELLDLGRLISWREDAVLPSALGRYENLRFLGQGGLSTVFLAYDPRLRRDVALKILADLALPPGSEQAWVQAEGRGLARVRHPSVVQVFEVEEADGRAYVAMEYVDGPTLQVVLEAVGAAARGQSIADRPPEVVAAARRLEGVPARLALVLALARALEACHREGIVHRDVKPANVLIAGDGTPKLIDFGLAHLGDGVSLGHTEMLVGTASYLAPEQVDRGRSGADAHSDVFSLGIVLYELLTLQSAFLRPTREQTLAAVSAARFPLPSRLNRAVSRDAEQVCLHCLEREPARRYPTMTALAGDLEALLELRAISIGSGRLRQTSLWLARHRRGLVHAGVAVLSTAAVLAGLWGRGARAERAELRRELRQVAARIDASEGANPQASIAEDLVALQTHARTLDEASVASWCFGRLGEEVRKAALPWAAASTRLFDLDVEQAQEQRRLEERQGYLLSRIGPWSQVFSAERILLGPDSPNQEFFRFGTATVEAGCVVYAVESLGNGYPQPIPLDPWQDLLPAGEYRIVRGEGDDFQETEYEVTPLGRHQHLTPVPFRYAGGVVRVVDPLTLPLNGDPRFVAQLWPLAIADHDLTWAEVAEVIDVPPSRLAGGGGEPADLTWEQASECARRLGCRLPAPHELLVLEREGTVTLEGPGYWTTDHETESCETLRWLYRPTQARELGAEYKPVNYLTELKQDSRIDGGAHLRVVHSLKSVGPER